MPRYTSGNTSFLFTPIKIEQARWKTWLLNTIFYQDCIVLKLRLSLAGVRKSIPVLPINLHHRSSFNRQYVFCEKPIWQHSLFISSLSSSERTVSQLYVYIYFISPLIESSKFWDTYKSNRRWVKIEIANRAQKYVSLLRYVRLWCNNPNVTD